MTDDRLEGPKWLAAFLDVPLATVYKWSSEGTGPRSIRVGKHLRYRRADVDRWLEEHAVEEKTSA